jgi:hypothetical protein
MEIKELREKIADILQAVSIGGDIAVATTQIIDLFSYSSSGNMLFMDLAHRLIKHILKFNPDEHDIELNLCGIIACAKQKKEETCICMDCGEILKTGEQSKHIKKCKKDHSLKPLGKRQEDN